MNSFISQYQPLSNYYFESKKRTKGEGEVAKWVFKWGSWIVRCTLKTTLLHFFIPMASSFIILLYHSDGHPYPYRHWQFSNKTTILKNWIIPIAALGIYGTRKLFFDKNTKPEPSSLRASTIPCKTVAKL